MHTVSVATSPTSYLALARRLRSAGLFDRRPGYYTAAVVLTVAAFAAGWTALVIVGNSWAALVIAALLGLVFTQLGFLGHDAGHQQIFASPQANRLLGLTVANVLIGLSFSWWVTKHNAHHAHPNEVGRDPDVGDGLVTAGALGGRRRSLLDVSWLMARWQAPLFFPLMLLRSTGMHVLGTRQLLARRDRRAAFELLLIGLHAALYLTVVLLVLSPLKALAFVVVQQAVFSLYLGCSFAPNHKAMPLLESPAELSFATRQVVTARNVAGGALVTALFGGLNYQIEHHLFPTMPRPNLKRAQRCVREFCAAGDLEYREDSFVGAMRSVVRQLAAAGATHAVLPKAAT